MTTDLGELVHLFAATLRMAGEVVARLLTVHLQESLETSTSEGLEGRWTYRGGLFIRS